ncbi:MAG: NFACT family protein, partial [Cyanobium sp.]
MAAEQGREPRRAALQALDATALRAVLAELRPALLPCRFEKAQQADPHTVQLGLRSLHGHPWLELSWRAEAPRLLAIPAPHRQGEGSTLAQQLQHGLRGLTLVALEQHGWERVVELRFAPRPGEPPRRSLVLELMGRHSNLFLLDEDRRVIALAHQVRDSQSRLRPIGTGDAYTAPPPLRGDRPNPDESLESWRRRLCLQPLPLARALPTAYQGVGPALARQLCEGLAPADPAERPEGTVETEETGRTEEGMLWSERPVQELGETQWQILHQSWQRWLEAVESERFALHWETDGSWRCWSANNGPLPEGAAGEPDGATTPLPINTALARYYAGQLGARRRQQRRDTLGRRLQQALEREHQEAHKQQALLEAVPAGEGLREQADALLCLPSPSRAQIDEAQKLYRRARKLRRSAEQILPRLESHRQKIANLESSLIFLEQAEDDAALDALEEECVPALDQPRRARRPADPQPLELRTTNGLRLQVGRNHRQNEWISLRQARRG